MFELDNRRIIIFLILSKMIMKKLFLLSTLLCFISCSADSPIKVSTEIVSGKLETEAVNVAYNIEWPTAMSKGNVITLQSAILSSLSLQSTGSSDVKNIIEKKFGSEECPYSDGMYIDLNATMKTSTSKFISYICVQQFELYNREIEFNYFNYDVEDDKVLTFLDVFKSVNAVSSLIKLDDKNINDKSKFLLLEDSISIVVDEYASDWEIETVGIVDLKNALTPKGKFLYGISDASDIASSFTPEFTSLDRQTFQLFGDVTKVVTTTIYDVDMDGTSKEESYSCDSELAFDTNAKALLNGNVKRDEKGRIIYWEENPDLADTDGMHYEEWIYSSNGNVDVKKEYGYAGSSEYKHIYTNDNELVSLISSTWSEGDEGKEVVSYNILEKDEKGNWLSRIVKTELSWEYTEEITVEYRKEIRTITYK